jgi:eukaryotic-like serine/threonine-protein kinase
MADVVVSPKGLLGELVGDGRYDLREFLGGGSMGYVYRAMDRRLEMPVVIKIPRQNRMEKEDFRRRFQQESKFLVKLTHPHIVGILDVGEHKGLPYFVMPFVGGGSLRARQRNEFGIAKGLPPESLKGWLREIARALDFIHSQRCVHRDVKPDNILFDEHGHAFLSDFGLSKVLGAAQDDVTQTAAGAIVGTPLYVAPELVLGEAFDGRADQYSLALTVYEALSGTNPFEGPSSSATMVNQANKVPPPLLEFSPRIGGALSRAVARGLAKPPDERYPSCVALAEDVLSGIEAAGVNRSSVEPRPQAPGRSSSASNALDDTSPASRLAAPPRSALRASMVRTPNGGATADAPMHSAAASRRMQFVATAQSPIVKAKSRCPSCSKSFTLQPAFAGKRAACKACGIRLLISPDFSEVQQLELVEIRDDAGSSPANRVAVASAGPGNESDVILGQELFGWKLSRRLALGLATVLVLLLMLIAVYFTNQANQAERAREREMTRPRQTEG